MEKMNRVIFLLKSLPVVFIVLLLLPNPNRILYAQTASPSVTQTSASNANQNQSKPLDILNSIFTGFNTFGVLISAYFAFASFRKSKSLDEQLSIFSNKLLKDEELFSEFGDKLLDNKQFISKIQRIILPIIEQRIDQESDPNKKKELLEFKQYLEEEIRSLGEQHIASQKARNWLRKNRENLTDEAVAHVLENDSCSQKIRDKFRLNINRYLYGIQESLDIGDYDLLHELDIEEALTKSFYEKALNFILEEKVSKNNNLSADEITEMKKYFDYTIQNVL